MPFPDSYLDQVPGFQVGAQGRALFASAVAAGDAEGFVRFLAMAGPHPAALFNLAECYCQQGRFEESLPLLREASQTPGVPAELAQKCAFYAGNCLASLRRFPEALGAFGQCHFEAGYRNAGRCLVQMGRSVEAAQAFEAAEDWLWAGLTRADSGQFDVAREHLRRAREQQPESPLTWFGLGVVALRLGAADEARQAAQHVVTGGLVIDDFAILEQAHRIVSATEDLSHEIPGWMDLLMGRQAPPEAPGLLALTGHLQNFYRDEPLSLTSMVDTGNSLDYVWVFSRPEYWHYVSIGLSELYEKESPNPARSGYGLELSLRLARHGEDESPIWPVTLLRKLARYVYNTGSVFDEGHHIEFGGPIDDETPSVTVLAFALDPELGSLDTPFGQLKFLSVVGLRTEQRPALDDGAEEILARIQVHNPLMINDV